MPEDYTPQNIMVTGGAGTIWIEWTGCACAGVGGMANMSPFLAEPKDILARGGYVNGSSSVGGYTLSRHLERNIPAVTAMQRLDM